MTVAALIVAAGQGRRAGGPEAKQWRVIAGRRVIDWTLAAFESLDEVALVALALPADALDRVEPGPRRALIAGADSRAGSVRAGLAALEGRGVTRVLIHDVARPCVPPEVIRGVLAALDETPGAAPGLALSDALWRGADGMVEASLSREGLFAAQTPQGFHFDAILAAHRSHGGAAADDVEVARAAGLPVRITPGAADNIKITGPDDFARAAAILERR